MNVFGRPEDGPAERSLLVGDGVKVIKDDLLEVHFHLLHLAEDDATLALDFLSKTLPRMRKNDVADEFSPCQKATFKSIHPRQF